MNPAVRLIEKRREPRRPARGTVTLRLPLPHSTEVRGELVDVSESGFRAAHSHTMIETGQVVRFEHAELSGEARVIWNRIAGKRVETGFLIL